MIFCILNIFEKVKNTIERLGLQNFIRNSPKGYQSPLAPEGKGLPRNIIVKLLLARSIVHEPALLVLENPFSELDQSEKENIIDFLMTPSQPWSMVTISTDPYLAQKCDRILQMQKGRIIRSGTYREMQGLFNQ